MNEDINQEEFESEDYDTSESDYPDDGKISIHNWDESIDPNTIDNWASADDRQSAIDYWNEINPPPWDRISEPREEDFETYEDFLDAKIEYKAAQKLAGMAPLAPPPIEDPRDCDPLYIEKSQIIAQIQKYEADEARANAADDLVAARHAKQMRQSYEKDFERLETEHPTPGLQEAVDAGLKQYQADLENVVNNREEFNRRLEAAGSE